ncbi:MAG TPA: hypothetical protein VL092_12130, partial [Chitinophagaceae bacterium]|nr:hypothetical protein [Chitinophagaceae bacterium]
MKKTFLIASAIICALALSACSKKNKMYSADNTPTCLKAKIEQFNKSKASCPSGASMKQYTFQHKTVYVFDPG